MPAKSSTMLELGTAAPPFVLPDTDGRLVSLDDVAGPHGTLVVFLCNHCPYVQHVRAGVAAVGRDYVPRGIGMVAISPNDVEQYPEDSPARMAEEKIAAGYTFPYLYDESQDTAQAYRAACTPDFYLFGRDRRLVYRGQLDGSRPGNGVPVTGADLRRALEAVLAGGPVDPDQRPSIGCSIKWKPGNEPEWWRNT